MIMSRRRKLDCPVEKCCNNHSGPTSIARPRAIVVQVTNLSITESLLYIVVSEAKFSGSSKP